MHSSSAGFPPPWQIRSAPILVVSADYPLLARADWRITPSRWQRLDLVGGTRLDVLNGVSTGRPRGRYPLGAISADSLEALSRRRGPGPPPPCGKTPPRGRSVLELRCTLRTRSLRRRAAIFVPRPPPRHRASVWSRGRLYRRQSTSQPRPLHRCKVARADVRLVRRARVRAPRGSASPPAAAVGREERSPPPLRPARRGSAGDRRRTSRRPHLVLASESA